VDDHLHGRLSADEHDPIRRRYRLDYVTMAATSPSFAAAPPPSTPRERLTPGAFTPSAAAASHTEARPPGVASSPRRGIFLL
jgi:hypothetical protein